MLTPRGPLCSSAVRWSGYGYRSLLCSLPQSYDTELLLPRENERIPMQPVVVVKSESEPSAISFMGALRIPVSHTCEPVSITCVTLMLSLQQSLTKSPIRQKSCDVVLRVML